MSGPRQRALAVLFSVLLVTVGFGPVLAEPPGAGQGGPPNGPDGPGNGPPTDAPAGEPGTATSTATPTDAGNGPGRGPPANDSDDDARDGNGPPGRGSPGNGPPSDAGPPDDTPGNGDESPSNAGPPPDAGPPSDIPDGKSPSDVPINHSNESERPVNTSIGLDDRGSALAHRLTALALLEKTTLAPGHGDDRATRYASLLNDTRQFVLDANRTTSAALFRDDKRVVAPVHRRAPTVAAHLLVSESILAETAIDDAQRVRDELRARNVSFNESAVAGQIRKAERAYRQGGQPRDRDDASPGAVEHYRRAWTHAQRALDIMDEAVVPQVTVHTQEDIPQAAPSNHSINGTIFDVRGYELEGTVTTDDTSKSTTLHSSTVPGTTVQFNTSVEFPAQPLRNLTTVNVSVTATDPGVDVTDRGYDAEDQRDLHRPQTGRHTVGFDGDGLPSDYERRVTRSDPFDPDSDFEQTPANEAGNGVVDARENTDNDSLIAFEEFRAGTDPFDADTDDDALSDGFEDRWPSMDPVVADTDGDGVTDAREDADGDGLTNREEATHGTNPIAPDTDLDGLKDSREVSLGTDPARKDSDDDGLTDAEELEVGTLPLNPDTDADGVVDGNETRTRAVTDDRTDVSVAVTGRGFPASDVSVTNVTPNESAQQRVSPIVRVSNRSTFDNATVTLPIDTEMVTSEGSLDQNAAPDNLTVFKWDPATERLWEPVPTTVDAENGTASASVESFSYFVAADGEAWTDDLSLTIDAQWPVFDPFEDLTGWSTDGDVGLTANGTLVLESVASDDDDGGDDGGEDGDDDSGGGDDGGEGDDGDDPPEECSVSDPDADCDGDGLTNSEEAELDTDPLNPDTDGGGADDGAEVIVGTDPLDETDDLLNEQTVGEEPGQTASATRPLSLKSGAASINLRARLRANVSGPDAVARVVVETAGTTVTAFEVDDGSVPMQTVQADLSDLAGTDATVRVETSGTARIAITHVEVRTDTDGDGLSDAVENQSRESRLVIPVVRENSRGNLTMLEPLTALDWDDPDTDGDGLEDGEEVDLDESGVLKSATKTPDQLVVRVVSATSHPNFVNSDGMGLNDSREAEKGSRALVAERIIIGTQLAAEAVGEDLLEPEVRGTQHRAIISSSFSPDLHSTAPQWIEDANIDLTDCDVPQNCTYLKFDLVIFSATLSGSLPADELPTAVTVDLELENRDINQMVYPPQGPEQSSFIVEDGSNVVSLVVRTNKIQEFGNVELGTLRFGILTPTESRFSREPHPPEQVVGDDFGAFTYINTSRPYKTSYFGAGEAILMASESMQRFEAGLVATASVYAPGFARIRVPTTPSGPTTEAAFETTKLILRNKASARQSSVHIDTYEPDIISAIKNQTGETAIMNGPVLVREN